MPLLKARNLSKRFGGLAAISELSFDIHSGEVVGLIGPNGAGKTTLFNIVAGTYPPSRGKVIFNGKDITGKRPDVIASKGLARTFQANVLFSSQTVLENVIVAHILQSKLGFFGRLFKEIPGTRSARKDDEILRHKSIELLDYMGLAHLKNMVARNLSHGHQRALGVCMAIATQPMLLLLDEPVSGMNPEETLAMIRLIKGIHDRGITIMIVEHDMRAVMGLSKKIIVLNYGRIIAEGTPDEVRQNKEVIEAYLGVEENVT